MTSWEGKFIDSKGRSGGVTIEGKGEGESKGQITLEIIDRDKSLITNKGEVTLSESEDSLQLTATFSVEGQKEIKLTGKMSKQDAGKFASSSASGSYSVAAENTTFPLSSGIIIVWKFKSD